MNKRISWMLADYDLKKVVDPYGGWPNVLSTEFDPPEELILHLERLTCSRELLTEARLRAHEVYLSTLAFWLWMIWRSPNMITRSATKCRTPYDSNVRWQDLPDLSWWDRHEIRQPMEIFSISKDDVERYIETHRSEMPPLEYNAPSPPESPPAHEAPVPRLPLPSAGPGEIALPLPSSEEQIDE